MPDLEDRINTVASGPAEVSGDAGTVKQHDLEDLIKADQHLQGQTAAAKAHRGLRLTKLVPPGTV
jgi:hypothetical protein